MHRAVGEKLSLLDQQEVNFDDVRAARDAVQGDFHKLLFVVIGELVDDEDALNDMLAAYHDQQRRIGAYLARRGGSAPDVDPESGEFLDEDEIVEPSDEGGDQPVADDDNTDI